MLMRFVRLTWENPTQTIATLYAKPDHRYYYTPGQYADIGVKVGDRIQNRTMTLTSLPSDPLVSFTTRFDRQHSGYKRALLDLQTNDELTITDAMGDLVLPLDDDIPLVFVAGGVAIASYVSMIRWLATQQDKRDVALLYAVRSTGDIVFLQDFTAYDSVHPMQRALFTQDPSADTIWSDTIVRNRLSAEQIMKYVRPESQIYLSGTEPMVEVLRQQLQQQFNIPHYRLAFDYFDGYSEL